MSITISPATLVTIGCAVLIGIITSIVSTLLDYKITSWQHWVIFALGMGSYIFGRIVEFVQH